MAKRITKPRHRGALVVYGDWLRMLNGDALACLILAHVLDQTMSGTYRATSRSIAKDLGVTTQQVGQRMHLIRECPLRIDMREDSKTGEYTFKLK